MLWCLLVLPCLVVLCWCCSFWAVFLVLWVMISFGALSVAGWVGVFGRCAPFSWSRSNLVFLLYLWLLVWFAIRGLFVLDLGRSSFCCVDFR